MLKYRILPGFVGIQLVVLETNDTWMVFLLDQITGKYCGFLGWLTYCPDFSNGILFAINILFNYTKNQ